MHLEEFMHWYTCMNMGVYMLYTDVYIFRVAGIYFKQSDYYVFPQESDYYIFHRFSLTNSYIYGNEQ